MVARAANVLGLNTDAGRVKPAPDLYPHQWSWDTAFIAIGLATFDLQGARDNLDALFAGQWGTGMVPHIVFDPTATGYFPGPDRWACHELTADAPDEPATSGICQPPLHAIAVTKVVEAASLRGGEHLQETTRWLHELYPKLLAWHRFLARERAHEGTGLIRIFHGWESGMDNSPRWDGPYEGVKVGPGLPPYERRDLQFVSSPEERPSGTEYDRYLWLVEEAKGAHYDQQQLAGTASFDVGDVFFTAIYAVANDHLADLAELIGAAGGAEARAYADNARAAVQRQVDPGTGLASDVDLRTGESLATGTIGGFAPLIAGGGRPEDRARLTKLLLSTDWAGHPGLHWPLPPSTSPRSAAFRPRSYWRGPVWPVMTWLLSWALQRTGEPAAAAQLREATLEQLAEGEFAEYYEPFSGEPLGARHQSWTAAAVLDWLCG
ncbi:MAG: glucosylglycerate hydrolase [Acidimicrobiales bacterium]